MNAVLATGNAHKLGEMRQLLPGLDLEPMPAGFPMPPEDGDSFAANALIKARAVHAATGGTVIADDSGIEAEALDGAPGIYSARFAGEGATDSDNLDKLQREVAAAAGSRRVAYVCVLALIDPDGNEHLFEGRCEGSLIDDRRGDGGFGYDPAVVPDEVGDGRTMAELSAEEKHAISHRGSAARLLADHLGV